MLLPVLAKAKTRAEAIGCLNNLKQMQLGWIMYADDHDEIMVPNGALSAPLNYSWVSGDYMGWDFEIANTNYNILKVGLLSAYLRNGVSAYRCPGDKVPSKNGIRVRSFSMNSQMGHQRSGPPDYYNPPNFNTGFKIFKKRTELAGQFSPSIAWIFLDEHPGSLNDGFFQVGMISASFPDLMASRHNNACGFSFADGHAEIHKWRDPRTIKPEARGVTWQNVGSAPSSPDWMWMTNHSTIKQ